RRLGHVPGGGVGVASWRCIGWTILTGGAGNRTRRRGVAAVPETVGGQDGVRGTAGVCRGAAGGVAGVAGHRVPCIAAGTRRVSGRIIGTDGLQRTPQRRAVVGRFIGNPGPELRLLGARGAIAERLHLRDLVAVLTIGAGGRRQVAIVVAVDGAKPEPVIRGQVEEGG